MTAAEAVAAKTAAGALAAVAAATLFGALAPGTRPDADRGAVGGGALAARAAPSNPAYDGRFAFVRLRYGSGGRGLGSGRGRGGGPVWAHDYPRAETNFLRILDETTFVGPNLEGRVILDVADPELFRYPVAYIVEVGYWSPTDEEVESLRRWLLKGGFLIVDDFRGGDMRNFEAQLGRVLPGVRLIEVEDSHDVFDSFFHIADPHALHPPTFGQYSPIYLGVYEDNDPDKRLMIMINYNQDIAEYWEFSDYGYFPIDLSNEAYKFGVNYIIYAMTH